VTYAEGGTIAILQILRNIIPDIVEPNTGRIISYMDYDPNQNMLIVHNTPSNLAIIEQHVEDLDIMPKQVIIESKFITVSTEDLQKVGWEYTGAISDLNARPREVFADQGTTGGAGGFGGAGAAGQTFQRIMRSVDIDHDGDLDEIPSYIDLKGVPIIRQTLSSAGIDLANVLISGMDSNFGITGQIFKSADGDFLQATFNWLSQLSNSELLSAPRITTMNRKPAVIADLQTQYFISQIIQQAIIGTAGTVAAGVVGAPTGMVTQAIPQAFNFGITLSVTPMIQKNNSIRLWLNPQVTTLVGTDEFDQTSSLGGQELTQTYVLPRTSVQAVWTNVIVSDGDTVVLGGLVRDQTTHQEERLPLLSQVPFLGFFFRGTGSSVNQHHLLIFVTVNVIDTSGAKLFAPAEEAWSF